MFKKPLHVFKYKDLGLTFFHYASKLTKKRTTSVLKTELITNNRKSLTRSTTNKQIYLISEWLCIKLMDISMPPILRNRIISEISLFTIRLDVTGEKNFSS